MPPVIVPARAKANASSNSQTDISSRVSYFPTHNTFSKDCNIHQGACSTVLKMSKDEPHSHTFKYLDRPVLEEPEEFASNFPGKESDPCNSCGRYALQWQTTSQKCRLVCSICNHSQGLDIALSLLKQGKCINRHAAPENRKGEPEKDELGDYVDGMGHDPCHECGQKVGWETREGVWCLICERCGRSQ